MRSWVLDLVGLLARLALGGVLLVAGLTKLDDLTGSVQSVLAYELMGYEPARFLGVLLPVVEVALGALLLVGLLTRPAALVGSLLMVVFVAGIASAWARGLAIDCGCFGDGGPVGPAETRYGEEIARDLGLAVAGLWLVARPHTLGAVDTLLRRGPR
jgi:uncharacterized membrane protein YphA (DoxX/SURF4 family)